jgi:FtsH-binding integral membrane protein
MASVNISELWQAAGILLGLQAASFSWRIQQEAAVAKKGDITWLPPADYLNLLAMLVSLLGVFLLPAVGLADQKFAQMAFGMVALLFVGHSIALAAHYELFTRGAKRSYLYFPRQEKLACLGVFATTVVYIFLWVRRDGPQLIAGIFGSL